MKSTQHFDKNKKGLECLNCGFPLRGDENFCSECGQVNDEIPLSIKQFVSEFFAGFLSFDTRFFKTIVPLLFKPGKVSKEYIEGKRRTYTNPFKMYLHTSIVFFLLMGINSTINNYKNLNKSEETNEVIKDSVFNELSKQGIDIANTNFNKTYKLKLDSIFLHTHYKQLFNDESIAKKTKDSVYQNIHDLGMNLMLNDFNISIKGLGEIDLNLNNSTKKAHKLAVKQHLSAYLNDNSIRYKSRDEAKKDNFRVTDAFGKSDFGVFINFAEANKDLSPSKALDSLSKKKTRMNLFKYQKAQSFNKLNNDKDFRKTYLKSIISKISIALFFLLPVFTLFFTVLYIRHPYNFTEHLVVVFNLQTVFFILLIIGLSLGWIFKTDIFTGLIFPLLFFFYIYKTLRNFYKQGRFKTIIKFFTLNFVYFILVLVGFAIVSFLSFLI